MTPEIWFGFAVVLLALALNIGFVVWSRSSINRIALRNLDSVREILRDSGGE